MYTCGLVYEHTFWYSLNARMDSVHARISRTYGMKPCMKERESVLMPEVPQNLMHIILNNLSSSKNITSLQTIPK